MKELSGIKLNNLKNVVLDDSGRVISWDLCNNPPVTAIEAYENKEKNFKINHLSVKSEQQEDGSTKSTAFFDPSSFVTNIISSDGSVNVSIKEDPFTGGKILDLTINSATKNNIIAHGYGVYATGKQFVPVSKITTKCFVQINLHGTAVLSGVDTRYVKFPSVPVIDSGVGFSFEASGYDYGDLSYSYIVFDTGI